jgi:hypothetical protein
MKKEGFTLVQISITLLHQAEHCFGDPIQSLTLAVVHGQQQKYSSKAGAARVQNNFLLFVPSRIATRRKDKSLERFDKLL